MFPESLEWPLRRWVNQAVDFLVVNYADSFEAISSSVLYVLVQIEAVLCSAPWWVIVLVLAGFGYRVGLTLGVVASIILIGSLGLWDLAMQTLALMLVAVGITIVIGIPIGIVMARSVIVRTVVRPILDLMQTMPSFVYPISCGHAVRSRQVLGGAGYGDLRRAAADPAHRSRDPNGQQ